MRCTKNWQSLHLDIIVDVKHTVRQLLPARIGWKIVLIMITIKYGMLIYGMPVAIKDVSI
jgi:hypothetical protein